MSQKFEFAIVTDGVVGQGTGPDPATLVADPPPEEEVEQ